MSGDVFVDKLVDIAVTGGLVRLDFANLAPGDNENDGQAKLVFSQRVIMPIDAFLQLSETVTKMISIMVDKGTLVKRDDLPSMGEGFPN